MKRIATLAVLAAASAAACAQSSVTLFGSVDASVRHVKNGDDSVTGVASGGASPSRIGLRGVEDLGGGLSAGFWLEGGLDLDTGSQTDAGRFWNRRSTVSLISNTLGEIRLGRDFTPTYTGYSDYDVFGATGIAGADKFSTTFGTTVDTRVRADNEVSYFTPATLGGFYGQLTAAAGEGVSGKKYYGGRLGYRAGPLDVSGSIGRTKVTPIAGEDQYDAYGIGASYDFGVVKVLGFYRQEKFDNQKLNVANVGAQLPLGPGALRASYTHANSKGTGIDGNDANQIALGYLYNLSKRTTLYTTVSRVSNDGAATFASYVRGSGATGVPTLAGGENSTGFEVGVRHAF